MRVSGERDHPLTEVVTLTPVNPSPDVPRLQVEVMASASGAVVALRGALDMSTTALLAFELGQVFARPDPPRVVLDLSGLKFCDSSGLGPLVSVWKRVQEVGGGLALTGVHGVCERILHRTALDRVFARYPSLAEAEAAALAAMGEHLRQERIPDQVGWPP